MIKSATVTDLHQWLQSGEVVLVDVREPEEWAQGHIAGATHIPLATVAADKMPSFQGKKLVMQCRSGGRSRTACGILTQSISGLDIYNLEGGIIAWVQAGYEVKV